MNMTTLCEVRKSTQDHLACIGLRMQFTRRIDFPVALRRIRKIRQGHQSDGRALNENRLQADSCIMIAPWLGA